MVNTTIPTWMCKQSVTFQRYRLKRAWSQCVERALFYCTDIIPLGTLLNFNVENVTAWQKCKGDFWVSRCRYAVFTVNVVSANMGTFIFSGGKVTWRGDRWAKSRPTALPSSPAPAAMDRRMSKREWNRVKSLRTRKRRSWLKCWCWCWLKLVEVITGCLKNTKQ